MIVPMSGDTVSVWNAQQICVDYLRVTVPSALGYAKVASMNVDVEDVRGRAIGFRHVEKLGDWYRRTMPYTASKAHGFDYESWECPGFTLPAEVAWWAGKGSKATCLDITVDRWGDAMRPVAIRDMIRSGKLVTDCEKVTLIDSGEDGQTLYVGSPAAERRLRIYEKGRQLGNETEILRTEVHLKGDMAADAFQALVPQVDMSMEDYRVNFRRWAAGYWCAHLQQVLEGPLIETWVQGIDAAELRLSVDDLEPWSYITALASQYGWCLSELHRAGLLVPWVCSMSGFSRQSRVKVGKVVAVVSQDLERLMDIAKRRGHEKSNG